MSNLSQGHCTYGKPMKGLTKNIGGPKLGSQSEPQRRAHKLIKERDQDLLLIIKLPGTKCNMWLVIQMQQPLL